MFIFDPHCFSCYVFIKLVQPSRTESFNLPPLFLPNPSGQVHCGSYRLIDLFWSRFLLFWHCVVSCTVWFDSLNNHKWSTICRPSPQSGQTCWSCHQSWSRHSSHVRKMFLNWHCEHKILLSHGIKFQTRNFYGMNYLILLSLVVVVKFPILSFIWESYFQTPCQLIWQFL